MNLHEVVDTLSESEAPDKAVCCLMGIFQLLRTIEQQEMATFDGCFSSLETWRENYGFPTMERVQQYLKDLGPIAEFDIPLDIVAHAFNYKDG